ncbi:MAG: hypothetical protein J4G00_11745 [Actinomycetia bacterium]|nr:hypothetical protein [Actinomycetes bacterium]
MSYQRDLLTAEAAVSELVGQVRSINDQWDNRSGNNVAYSDVEATLEDAVQRAQDLAETFQAIEAPPELDVSEAHQFAGRAVARMPDLISEMLAGLRSSDTGQARQAALAKLLAAFDIFKEAIEQVASTAEETGIPQTQGPDEETTTTTTTEATTTTQDETTTTTDDGTTTTAAAADPPGGVDAQWWRPGLVEEAMALVDPASVGSDHWQLVEEQQAYGTRAFYVFHHLSTPPAAGDSLTQQHRDELEALGEVLAGARSVLEQSPIIYYPHRFDIRWASYPDEAIVSAVYPRGETRQVTTRRSGSAYNANSNVEVPSGPPIRPTTPFGPPRWADTADALGQTCPPVEEIWVRGASVTDTCTLNALQRAMDYLWTESSELRQRAVRDGQVLTDLFTRLDTQDNAYMAALYGAQGRLGVTTAIRNVRWVGNWPGASMILLEYQNTHSDRELTAEERADAMEYFGDLAEQGIAVEPRFLEGDFTLGFSWPWESALMVRTADGTWRMSFRSFCGFHRTLHVVDQPRLLCPDDPTPHFPDSSFYDRDLWPPNHALYYDDPRSDDSPRFGGRYVGVPPS